PVSTRGPRRRATLPATRSSARFDSKEQRGYCSITSLTSMSELESPQVDHNCRPRADFLRVSNLPRSSQERPCPSIREHLLLIERLGIGKGLSRSPELLPPRPSRVTLQ